MKNFKSCLGILLIGGLIVMFISYFSKTKGDSCKYYTATMTAWENNSKQPTLVKKFPGCFDKNLVDAELSQFEVSSLISPFKVAYIEENDPNVLRFLDVKFEEEEPIRWRANLGHMIVKNQKPDTLSFVFADDKTGFKGTIVFSK